MEEVKKSGFELRKNFEAWKSNLEQASEPVGFEPVLS